MKVCGKCGTINADTMDRCGGCGASLAGSGTAEPSTTGLDRAENVITELVSQKNESQILSLVAIAINVRRIFILFLYLVFVTVAVQLYGIWVEASYPSLDAARNMATMIGVVIGIAGIASLYAAVIRKGLSRLS